MEGQRGTSGRRDPEPPPIALWSAAELRLAEGRLAIDLQEPVDEAMRHRLAGIGLPGTFAVITPCNPQGRGLSPEDNARRVAAAAALLAEQGLPAVPAVGQSPDGAHREEGWALAITRSAALVLAREWEQQGLYWWDGARFWIVSTHGDFADIQLPIAHPRIASP